MRRHFLHGKNSIEYPASPVLKPVVAERSVCGQPDGLEIQRPTHAEVADLMRAAVIRTNHLDGKTRDRYRRGVERITPPSFARAQSFFTCRQKTRARMTIPTGYCG